MGILDKIIDVADDVTAKIILKASEKQKRVNELLEKEGSDVYIETFEVTMGTPPIVNFCIKPSSQK